MIITSIIFLMFITFLEGSGDFPGGLLIRIWVFPPLCKRFHKPMAVQPPKMNLFIMYTMQGTAKVLIDIKIHSLILKTIHTFSPNKYMKSESVSSQSCPTLCDPMDYILPGSSVHGILQARILEWVAISFSRGSSWPRDWTWVSCIAGRLFYHLSHLVANRWLENLLSQFSIWLQWNW